MQHKQHDAASEGMPSMKQTEAVEWRHASAADDDHSEELEQLAFEADIRAQLDQGATEAEWHAEQEQEAREEASRLCRRRDPWRDPTDPSSDDDDDRHRYPDGYVGW